MNKTAHLFLIGLLFFGSASLGFAQAEAEGDSAAEKKALATVVDEFEKDFKSGEFKSVFEAMPPGLFDAIADKAGIDVEVLKGEMETQITKAMSAVKFVSFSMDVDSSKMQESKTGRPYTMIPTEMTIEGVDGQKMQVKTETLALKEEGVWYLMRMESRTHSAILGEAYPDLKGLKVPKSVRKVIE